MILYPTETIYALGVNAFVEADLALLYKVKGRAEEKAVSVLVRDLSDIERYAHLGVKGRLLAESFLPGPLTLVLAVRDIVPYHLAKDRTLGFRISSDPIAQKVIADFMFEFEAPLTCTSANKSLLPTLPRVEEILVQLGKEAEMVTEIYNDGAREGLVSTVVRVVNDELEILREGAISLEDIYKTVSQA
jgi:L-threonylcarbamoyladenylate synthase